jgi:GxxExxY protein
MYLADNQSFFCKYVQMNENEISYNIRGAAFNIHNELGPGLLESVYETALAYELEQMGYKVRRQVGIPMSYKKIDFDIGFRLDLLINELVIVEV